MQIENVLSFTKFLNQMRTIERTIYYTGSDRRENDAEHCRQLAVLSWYIIATDNLPLSLEKVLQYCLIHDIAEIYAGDVEAIGRTPEQQAQKELNEKAAVERIEHEFPEGHVLRERLDRYEKRQDEESKFVYALDKLIPLFNIYNDGGHWRKERKITLDAELRISKEGKVQISPEVEKLWLMIYPMMKEQESTMFHIGEK